MTPTSGDEAAADAVQERLRRLRAGRAWGSLMSAQEFAAVSEAGFDPVGQVFGLAVIHIGSVSLAGRCSGTPGYTPRTDLAAAGSGPFSVLLKKRYGARNLALSRAVEECRALGGDGILGLRLRVSPFPAGGTEFALAGTAVRARTRIRPAAPFTSHVSGQEFARLLRAGWVPAALTFAISLGARHDVARTRQQTRRAAPSREVGGYAELVKDTRRDAREQLRRAIEGQGADGLVVDEMTLHISERECPAVEGGRDHVAEATILGTSLASFAASPATAAHLTIMRLDRPPATTAPTGLSLRARVPEPSPEPAPEGGLLDRYVSSLAARQAARGTFASTDPAALRRKHTQD
jgi:uncharacterized protein YbjQ (UPF0145 family)